MLDLDQLGHISPSILMIGSHRAIIQSILDFDYVSKKPPSVKAIIASGRRYERFFYGTSEILLPLFPHISSLPTPLKNEINLFVNAVSARRTLASTQEVFEQLPNIQGGSIFAEDVPEEHALKLFALAEKHKKFIVGCASVGLIIPGTLKLGAIGGVDYRQLIAGGLTKVGSTAVFSASGGMTNEIIQIVARLGGHLSFALSFGGDRFPVLTPKEAFLAAETDIRTKVIAYYGELGGSDEYEIADLLKKGIVRKKVICYIAGSVAEMFDSQPQFGHAKALAEKQEETAIAKQTVLKNAGAKVAGSFSEFVDLLRNSIEKEEEPLMYNKDMEELGKRRRALIATSVSGDREGVAYVLGEDLLTFAKGHSFGFIVASLFLGKKISSVELEKFVDFILRLLVDHGPYVSGAMNTIVASRAGRDMVSSLSAGLLTIGSRFGGAINQAASNWFNAVSEGKDVNTFVEEFAIKKEYIAGIGHKKYRSDFPDPRVREILSFANSLKEKKYTTFAQKVETITTSKKGNLILNVDGAIAAMLLDILSEKENMDEQELKRLIEIEFFNSLFVLSRSVGFIAHFLDQKRLDEGLFRLEDDMVADASS